MRSDERYENCKWMGTTNQTQAWRLAQSGLKPPQATPSNYMSRFLRVHVSEQNDLFSILEYIVVYPCFIVFQMTYIPTAIKLGVAYWAFPRHVFMSFLFTASSRLGAVVPKLLRVGGQPWASIPRKAESYTVLPDVSEPPACKVWLCRFWNITELTC